MNKEQKKLLKRKYLNEQTRLHNIRCSNDYKKFKRDFGHLPKVKFFLNNIEKMVQECEINTPRVQIQGAVCIFYKKNNEIIDVIPDERFLGVLYDLLSEP
ncbi:hypothetical protein QJU93_09900 [Pasteurella skyensis]|uniref:Uncharacterized protein n=1 Tax=Phocoenobacter skyensis TaxID=97481 RepID=A0AAJ6NBE6_9PAST|nr:hypothetical protein [Pasteurella skyensis]MDP8173667.1 hypothetical protein [Pasteurella skyensis]MDP8178035.1 hypothetical protein [Pasteurella skyensis]